MVSTFLSYRMYTADYAKSMSRTLNNSQVAREQAYYRDNIGKVKSVDDLLKDQRLYSYAMKAYGLEDMVYAKAFMRKVLESDITTVGRTPSFVDKLVDKRYLEFAKAFNFTTKGEVAAGQIVAQDAADEAETIGLYSEQRTRQGAAAAAEIDYLKARLSTITSASAFVADDRLFSFALNSFGLDASIASKSAITSVLKGDLSVVTGSTNYAKYEKLAAAFSFNADGSVGTDGPLTSAQLDSLINTHYATTKTEASPAAAAFKTDLFTRLMASVTSVDDLIANPMLRDYALVAVGLDPVYVADATVRTVLTADPDDPDGPLATLGASFKALAASFNFNSDGTLDSGVEAQTAAQLKTLTDSYFANYTNKASEDDKLQTSFYTSIMDTVTSVDEFLKNSSVYNYALKAYGIDPNSVTKATMRQVLLSDPADPLSFAARKHDARYTALAAAFNFGADGAAQGTLKAQYNSAITDTVARYTATLGKYDIDKTIGKAESEYYGNTIATITSVDELLADKRLVTYLGKAYGLSGTDLTDRVLRQALTSDLSDLKSFANASENARFRDLASAFNFDAKGIAKRAPIAAAQDPNALQETQDLYIRQTIETQAGVENQGVRLALYFQRKAASITSAYSILADKALLEVVMTALGFPDSMAQADTDVLAKTIGKRLDIADFKDPKKVDKFLARFTALYDIENQASTNLSPASILLGGQDTGSVFTETMLSSIQAMKIRA